MSKKSFLLRILLSAMLCLNGGTALWASTGMALDPAHMVDEAEAPTAAHAPVDRSAHAHHHADTGSTGSTGSTAEVPAPTSGERHVHVHVGSECDCGAGMIAGCACNCAYPASCMAVSVPFAAQHARPAAAAAYVEIHAPLRGTGTIFRPPIG